MHFLDLGIIGWIVSINGDMGPETIAQSAKFLGKYNLGQQELTSFSASSITAIGITHSFESSTFVIPFSGSHKLFTLNISFQHKDPSLKDPRFKQKALSVYSIVFPVVIMPKIPTFYQAEKIFFQKIEQYETIQELIQEDRMDKITILILKSIIS